MNSKTLKIQIESDKKTLKEDTEAGYYEDNILALNTELERIRHKEILLEEILGQEQILAENEQKALDMLKEEWKEDREREREMMAL